MAKDISKNQMQFYLYVSLKGKYYVVCTTSGHRDTKYTKIWSRYKNIKLFYIILSYKFD